MIQKRTAYNFVRTSELRRDFYEQISQKYVIFQDRQTRFDNEMKSWRIQGLLSDNFATKE